MTRDEQIKKTEEAIKNELKEGERFVNPWIGYNHKFQHKDDLFCSKDRQKINNELNSTFSDIKNRILWETNDEYDFKNQFPVPINGNFHKAKILLLYSNPATEEDELKPKDKEKLIKCYALDPNAKLVIADNPQWRKWYIGELDKFFAHTREEKNEFNIENYFDDFCFINLCAYATNTNWFDFSSKALDQLKKLPSTIFVERLVKIGIKAGKQILIMRRSEGVWKHSNNPDFMFEKLDSYYTKAKNIK